MRFQNPIWGFGILALGIAILLAFIISLALAPFPAWLVAINFVAIAFYRYDKAVAGTSRTRVPERVLLLLEATGGTLGAAIAMWLIRPRHKTRSAGFLVWYFSILILQVAITAAILFGTGRLGI